jgi:hydroxymethylpyrimidine pyrophosphatase-like HAD family hydrolase
MTTELVVTDLDGTLWGADERIHTRTLGALAALERRGLPLLVATGRRLRSALDTLARCDLVLPMVVLDGAMGRVDGRSFHDAAYARDAAQRVLAAFLRHGVEPCVYVELPDIDVFVGERPSTSPRHLERMGPWVAQGDLEEVVRRERVYSFGVAAGDPVQLADVLRDVAGDSSGSITRDLLHGGATLMARPAGVSKWEGVLAWCRDQGLDADRVLAVGDGENDVELLSAAAVSVVVRDGCDEALALADHVIAPPAEGGWSEILELAS